MKPGNLSNQVPIPAANQSWMMRESDDKKFVCTLLNIQEGTFFCE